METEKWGNERKMALLAFVAMDSRDPLLLLLLLLLVETALGGAMMLLLSPAA